MHLEGFNIRRAVQQVAARASNGASAPSSPGIRRAITQVASRSTSPVPSSAPSRASARKIAFANLARQHGREWGDIKTPWIAASRYVDFPEKRGGTYGVPVARHWFTSWAPSWWRARPTTGNAAQTLGGLGLVAPSDATITAPADTGTGGTIFDTIGSIFTAAIPAYSQYRLMKTNEELIKAGKAPLDPAQVAPTVRVVAEPGAAAQNLTRMALIGAGVLGGLFVVSKMVKKR